MSAVQSKVEACLVALQSLSKAQKKLFMDLLLDDPELREDLLDLAVFRQRQNETPRPFRQYLDERKNRKRSQ